jgi:hypothetical protein
MALQAKFKVKSLEIEVGKLRLHNRANRELRPGRVKNLERDMDLDALGRFAIWRDGRNFYVIDGQHRKVALENLGLADWPVRCDVYEGMSFTDACEQFLKLNDAMNVRPYDKFDKGVKAGRRECVETLRIIEDAGYRIADQARDGNLVCVAAAVDTWKKDEGESLADALKIASQAWGHTSASVEGYIVEGLGLFAHRFNGEVDYAALVKKLAKYHGGPSHLIGAARGQREIKGGTLSRNVALIVTDLYNKGRRSGQVVL